MEPQKVAMIYDGQQPSISPITSGKHTQLPYLEAFEITDKTPKAQLLTIEGWNMMRARLIELGEMKNK